MTTPSAPDAPPLSGARPRLVGIFTLVALALLLGGIVALTSGWLFADHRTFVVYFPGAVGGLKDGAPVTIRQVPIGRVRDIDLVFTGQDVQSYIVAVIEIRRSAVRSLSADRATALLALSDHALAEVFIKGGLRASVRSSSPVAGQKSIDLDFHPELPARFARIPGPYPELPTAPTGMEVLNEKLEATLKKLSEVPIDEVLLQLKATLESTQKLIDGGDVQGAVRNLRLTLETANRTLAGAGKTLGNVDALLGDVRVAVGKTDATMATLGRSLEQLDRTLVTVDRNVERTADVQFESTRTLDEMRELLKSLRSLIETLQQHPEALLQGKPEPKEEK